jgi:uncharacterized membrane-anchored protein
MLGVVARQDISLAASTGEVFKMRRIVLATLLLVCTSALHEAPASAADHSLEDWCTTEGQSWDAADGGRCTVVSGALVTLDAGHHLTIGAGETFLVPLERITQNSR